MHKQISLIQNAFSAYFSSNEFALNNAITELRNATANSSLHENDPMQPSKLRNNNFGLEALTHHHNKSFLE